MIKDWHDIQVTMQGNPGLFLELTHLRQSMLWARDNVHVIQAFEKYAVVLRNSGNRTHYSAYTIRERLRWDSMLAEVGTQYKLSNNVTPFVARLVMEANPQLQGMFKMKH